MSSDPAFHKNFRTILLLFVVVNLSFFVYASTNPISWLQEEMSCYRFYWEMDSVDRLTLHSGLTLNDLAKPFVSRYTVGAFRPRQIASLVEMLSFKAGQKLGVDYFRDYFLILLHLLNVFLLWLLLRRLSDSPAIAWVGALLFLNSGAALSTLLFPFRNAKFLVITFFLLGWNLIAATPGRFDRARSKTLALFSFLFVCGCFTDETFVFLAPIYLIFLYLYQGREVALGPRLWKYLAGVFLGFLGIGTSFYYFSQHCAPDLPLQGYYWKKFAAYYVNPLTYRDVVLSFGLFLKRNFGYWGFTGWGLAAWGAFATIISYVYKNKPRPSDRMLAAFVLGIIILKALLMPHLGWHKFIMPEGAVFPSLLFFSYYYIYFESVLIIFLLGYLLRSYRSDGKALIVLMGCVTLINISNMLHAPQGIADALKFHGLDDAPHREAIANIRVLNQVLRTSQDKPLYLSFPAGDLGLVDGRFGANDTWSVYTSYILTMFLPALEKGEAVISLQNLKRPATFVPGDELAGARGFYDVVSRDFLDLGRLKQQFGETQLKPLRIREGGQIRFSPLAIEEPVGELILFVRGKADIHLELNEQSVHLTQDYGQSYRLFRCHIEKGNPAETLKAKLSVQSLGAWEEVDVVGPFFIPS